MEKIYPYAPELIITYKVTKVEDVKTSKGETLVLAKVEDCKEYHNAFIIY